MIHLTSTFCLILHGPFFARITNFLGINLPEVQPVDALEDDDVPLERDVALLDETVRRGEGAEAVQVAAARPPHRPHELPHGAVRKGGKEGVKIEARVTLAPRSSCLFCW